MLAVRPYSTALAISRASSSSRHVTTDSTGPKTSLLAIGMSWRDVGDERRGHEPAAVQALRRAAAGEDRRARVARALDVREDAVAVHVGDDRAHLRALGERVADRQRLERRADAVDDLVGDRLVHDQPRRRAAGLAARHRQVHPDHRPVRGPLEVGVGVDDAGVLPAELERDRLHDARGRRGTLDREAGAHAAGEGDAADRRVAGHARRRRPARSRPGRSADPGAAPRLPAPRAAGRTAVPGRAS